MGHVLCKKKTKRRERPRFIIGTLISFKYWKLKHIKRNENPFEDAPKIIIKYF